MAVADARLFFVPVLSCALVSPDALRVERHAPTAASPAIVPLDKVGEIRPRRFVEWPGEEPVLRLLSRP